VYNLLYVAFSSGAVGSGCIKYDLFIYNSSISNGGFLSVGACLAEVEKPRECRDYSGF